MLKSIKEAIKDRAEEARQAREMHGMDSEDFYNAQDKLMRLKMAMTEAILSYVGGTNFPYPSLAHPKSKAFDVNERFACKPAKLQFLHDHGLIDW